MHQRTVGHEDGHPLARLGAGGQQRRCHPVSDGVVVAPRRPVAVLVDERRAVRPVPGVASHDVAQGLAAPPTLGRVLHDVGGIRSRVRHRGPR
jgi:hypothetical protein